MLGAVPLIDGHNDLLWAIREDRAAHGDVRKYDLRAHTRGRTDLDRLRRGLVGAQLWSVYVPCELSGPDAARAQREQIDRARALVAAYPEVLGFVTDADGIERVFREGRVASLLAMEGGHALQESLDALREFYRLGVRSMALTHNCTTAWADAARDRARSGGLAPFGVDVVREMNRLGMVVDLAHAAVPTMQDAIAASAAPVVWSHTGVRALVDHPRNVPDDVIRDAAARGGLVMIAFVPEFVSAGPRATLADVVAQIEHVRALAGVDHVGIGADFDGNPGFVAGLEDVSTYPALFAALARRGWTRTDLAKLAGGNFLRVLRRVEAVADSLQRMESRR